MKEQVQVQIDYAEFLSSQLLERLFELMGKIEEKTVFGSVLDTAFLLQDHLEYLSNDAANW